MEIYSVTVLEAKISTPIYVLGCALSEASKGLSFLDFPVLSVTCGRILSTFSSIFTWSSSHSISLFFFKNTSAFKCPLHSGMTLPELIKSAMTLFSNRVTLVGTGFRTLICLLQGHNLLQSLKTIEGKS